VIQDHKEKILEIKKKAIEKVEQEVEGIYNEHKKVLGMLLLLIMELFDKYSLEGKFNVNRYQRVEILKELENMIIKHTKELSQADINISKHILEDVITESYQMHTDLFGDIKNITITSVLLDEIIFKQYKGDIFDNRITDNKRKLANRLYVELDKGLINNVTLEELSHNIQEIFKQTNYETYRLLMTEQSRVFDEVQTKVFIASTNVNKVMWVSALCGNTCPYCEMMDGSIFTVDDPNKPEIPAHVFCQCCWVPI
jgi:SPP1 gp7 family putative phage head morphogenesis protein